MSADPHRIVALELDQRSVVRWSAQVEHERSVAIFDLLESNHFKLVEARGPYRVVLALREANIIFTVSCDGAPETVEITLSTRPFRRVVKDYFIICDSYFQAIRGATPSRIEAIDMARRGLHNDGSEILREALDGKVEIDHDTARRLFTLVCVLHIRG